MANTLMFEVGVKSAKEQLEKVKQEFTEANGKLTELLKIKVSIDGIEAVTKALSQIGDTSALRDLRNEVAALNREFSVMSKGAGGAGDIAGRGIAADIERTSQSIERYTAKIKQLTEDRTRLIGGTRNSNYQKFTSEIEDCNLRLEGAKRKLEELNEQKNKPIASDSFRNATQEAKNFEDALGRIERAIGELKGGILINLDTSKFGPLTDQIQKLAGEIAGLIGELKTLSQVQSQPANNEAIKTQTKDVENLAKAKDKLTESNKKAADSQSSDESTNKVTNTYERYLRLLLEIENQMAAIGKIQLFGEQSGFSPTILKKAVDEFEKLKTVVDATIKGKPIAEGLIIPMTPEQLSQFVAQFSLLKTAYKDIVSEADKFNKQSERDFANAQKTVQSEIDKTVSKLKSLDESIKRGEASGRDMSVLSDAQSKLKGQLSILQKMTNSDYTDSKIVEKRISNIRQLREDTENLRKVEEKLTSAREKLNKAKDKDDRKRLNDEIESLNEAWIKYNELTAKIKELESLRDRGIKANIDITQIDSAIARYHDLKVAMMEIINNDGRNLRGNLTSQVWGDHNTKKSMQDAVADEKAYTQSLDDVEKRMRTAATAAEGLGKRIDALEARKVDFKGLDTTRLDAAIQRVKDICAELERFSQTGQSVHGVNANEIIRNMGLAAAKKEVADATEQLNRQLKQNTREAERASAMATQLTDSEQRLANAIKGSTQEMKGQSQVLSDLKMMAMQYLSVWGAQTFLHNIIEIGGQLEKQRLSIGAILQDAAHGEDLFDKIKRLAVQSPFGVVELDQFTKQLSAYGFKYNELYDMTKRLADISAGAGTEVSRLALALGHVRAEGALSGYTLRQFAMNNIPMITELSKKLSEVEGHLVTTADIRKRVSNKEIGYKDVEDVIKKLTDEGGMFYKMQEVISESVQAKFKNLKDSFDIMYGEIAKSSIGDILKDIAGVLTQFSRNWKSFIPIIESAGAAFLIYRANLLAVNMAIGNNAVAVQKSVIAYKQKQAVELQQVALSRKLTQSELELIRTKNMLTAADVKVMLATQALSRNEVLRMVTLKKLSVEETAELVRLGLFTQAEIKAAQAGSVLAARIKMIGYSMKQSLYNIGTMIFNKWTAMFAALSFAMSFYQKEEQYEEARKERMDDLWNRSREGQRNLGEMKAQYRVGLSAELDNDGLKQAIGDLKEKLKDYTPEVSRVFNEAFAVDKSGAYRKNVHSLAEQYEILAKALEDTEKAYARLTTIRHSVDDAIEATQIKESIFGIKVNNPFDSNVIENIKKYSDAWGEADTAMLSFMRDYHDEVQKALKDAGMNFLSTDVEGMEQAVRNLERHSEEEIKFSRTLYELSDKRNTASYGAWGEWIDKSKDMKKAWNELSNDIMTMGNRLFKNLTTRWGDNLSEWREDQRLAVYAVFDDIIGKEMEAAGIAENDQKYLRKLFMEPFGIDFQTNTEAAYEEINELKEFLEGITDKAWVIKLKVESSDSVEIIGQARKLRKEAKEGLKELEKDIKKAGLEGSIDKNGGVELGKAKTPAETQMLEDYIKKLGEVSDAEKALDAYHAEYETEKDKNKNKNKGGKGEDPFLKETKERIRIMKEAADAFKYWREKVGDKAAWGRVLDEFGDVLQKIGVNAKNVDDLRDNLLSIRTNPSSPYHRIRDRQKQLDVDKEIDNGMAKLGRSDFEKLTDEFLSKTKVEIDELTRSWETFNSVRDATGNIELAVQLSGVTYNEGNQNLADALKDKIQRDLDEISEGLTIDMNVNLSDEDIQRNVEEAFDSMKPVQGDGESNEAYVKRLAEYQSRIKGIVEEYQKWRDLQRDVVKTDIQNFGKLLGSIVDYKSEIQKLNDEYNKQKEMLDALYALGMIDKNAYDKAMGIIATNKDDAIWQKSATYIDLMNHSLAMTKPEIDAAAKAQEENLNARLTAGTIKAEDFYQEMVKLRKITTEWNTEGFLGSKGAFGSFVSGGNQGLMAYYDRRRNRAWRDYSNADAKDSPEAQEKLIEAQHYDKLYQSLAKLTDSAEDVINAFQTLQGGVDLLGNLFDSLGMGSAATAMSDAGGLLSGALGGASSLSALGPYGMAAGAALGLATSIAELNDKGIQREIEALQDNVEALEANTNSIRAARERTLGYDTGVLRRAMSGLYEDTSKKINFFGKDLTVTSAAKKAMKEYYNAGTNKTGYAAELENLKEMRANYLEMYDKENSKKKTSQSALNEYEQKIAELDEQIMYFVEDLANELWGIDFKAWASQISDALWTAFENGESALDAFHDAARDIISDVAKRMMNIRLIEPVFQELEEKLFGKMENGKRVGGAAYNYDTGQFNENETLKILGEFFGESGKFAKVIDSAENFYNMAKAVTGFDFGEDSTGSRSSSAISKAITEEQSNLLIALANTIRADVSVNRTMIAQYFPMFHAAITSGNASLVNIENHTAAIMRSNETIANGITEMQSDIRGLKNKTWRVPVS